MYRPLPNAAHFSASHRSEEISQIAAQAQAKSVENTGGGAPTSAEGAAEAAAE